MADNVAKKTKVPEDIKGHAFDVAVVGMACRFPGAADYRLFWENLRQGVDSVREIPPERWDVGRYYSPDHEVPGKSVSKWCGLLDGVDRFDHRFFNISAREARAMDPQQRLLLETAWHCLEDGGLTPASLQQGNTGVFVGVMANDYQQLACAPGVAVDGYGGLGVFTSILANRISSFFGLD